MENTELIQKAAEVLNSFADAKGRTHGDVAAAVLGNNGKVYTGVCVDTPSWGLCAERSALAAMVTDKEYKIQKVVAVWRDSKTNRLHVLPPCGVCRQFMRDIEESNLDAQVILGEEKTEKLRDLLPYHEWPEPLESRF
jgi:cytidine deaminase